MNVIVTVSPFPTIRKSTSREVRYRYDQSQAVLIFSVAY